MGDRVDKPGYEAVLFDMDGVLIQGRATTPEVYANAADDTLAELGADVSETERSVLRQPQFDRAMAERCRAVGIDPEEFWTVREGFASERANRRIGSEPRTPYEDTTVLATLSARLGVVSNNRRGTVEYVADKLFSGRFEAAVGRDPTLEGYRQRKPDPHYIERALGQLGVENALYVGDRGTDLLAARRAGIDGAILRRDHGQGTLEETPTLDLTGLEELRSALV
ncbi:MAG: haloacid dehalogenase family hydrolase [halophilic archaeon J07HX64]|jgi:haloacid dehalogenase superfamily, subfamily IA, variant 3 with third motif having DD or ED/haloacid dehalogenase superfamily, subfamily IA, variant 1 with third motif having Dx(3-4)D or Dx(3-4)E|nr:MAG: haloacid dehalogenase family hydrolase [halophilic archaeon J07HX64]